MVAQTRQYRDARGIDPWLWVACALALLSCLPFFVAVRPQMTDYASHLGRYYVMLQAGHNPVIDQYYEFHWMLTGNLGADLLMVPLGHLLGVERAAWLIGCMLPPLTGLGIVAVAWTLRGRIGIGSLLALVTIWSPAMGMGFYNFCLSIALVLWSFVLWIRLEEWRWRWAVFVPIGFVVWLCHMAGWGVLGVMVFGYEWHKSKSWRAFVAPWPLFPPAMLMFGDSASPGLSYGTHAMRYKFGIWLKALREQSMGLDLATAAGLLLIMPIALFMRRMDGRLGWAALILLILTLAVPRHLGGGDFADWRLIAVALMVGCLAIDWKGPNWFLACAASLYLVRLGMTTQAWHDSSEQLEEALHAMDYLPRGARVAGAVVIPINQWAIDPFEHAPSYSTVLRDALVNSHFAIPGIHMLHLKQGGKGFVDPSHRIMWSPGETIDLNRFKPIRQADYLWYFGDRPPDRMPTGAQVIFRTRGSFLARLAKPAGQR